MTPAKLLVVLCVLLYQPMMAYGLLMLANYWAGNARSAGGLLFMGLGLAAPLTAWLMTFFAPPLALICPASLALLYFLLDSEEKGLRRARRDELDAEMEAASLRVAEFPDDGAAHLTRAELLEKAGRWAEALEAYERAHRCSDYMLSAVQLETIRTRLADAEQDARGEGVAAMRSETEVLGERVEYALLALSVPVFFLLPYAALSLASVMLFLSWYRGYAKRH